MKMSLALAGAVLLGSSLAACGGGSDDNDSGGDGGDYCQEIKTAATTFGDLNTNGAADLEKAFTTFHDLADVAPDEVSADWDKLDGAITSVEGALDEAGIKLSDFDEIQAGKIPEGVDMAKLQGLATEFQKLTGDEFTEATTSIEKHAKSECDVDLNAP